MAGPSRNPAWVRDELILALDTYLSARPPSWPSDKVLEACSRDLNRLHIHEHRPDADRFRNLNGVRMKMANFASIDPRRLGKGLARGNRLEHDVWKTFSEDRTHLSETAAAIRDAIVRIIPGPRDKNQGFLAEPEEDGAPEGRTLFRLHRTRERDRSLVRRKKAKVARSGLELRCEACHFCFGESYGEVGEGYIECHHTKPLASLPGVRTTRLADLALVCANCHRILHRGGDALSVAKLQRLIGGRRDGNF
jgi:5-methylcytosine-specific restriction protein A